MHCQLSATIRVTGTAGSDCAVGQITALGAGGLGLTLVLSFSAWREYVREAGRNRLVLGFA